GGGPDRARAVPAGVGGREPDAAGDPQPGAERASGHGRAAGRATPDRAGAAGRRRRDARGPRHRPRDRSRRAAAPVRSVLHDQAPRRGQRARPVRLLRHRGRAQGQAARREPRRPARRPVHGRAADRGGVLTRGPLLAMLLAAAGCTGVGGPVPGAPAHHRQHGFANANPDFTRPPFWTRTTFFVTRMWATTFRPRRADLPHVDNDGAALRANGAAPTVTWIGHATLLFQLDGVNVLTDPQWSERASPMSFAGPRRVGPSSPATRATTRRTSGRSAPGSARSISPPLRSVRTSRRR